MDLGLKGRKALVAGGGRGIHEPTDPGMPGSLQDGHRAIHVSPVVFQGVLYGGHDVREGRQMEYPLGPGQEGPRFGIVGHVDLVNVEPGFSPKVIQIFLPLPRVLRGGFPF